MLLLFGWFEYGLNTLGPLCLWQCFITYYTRRSWIKSFFVEWVSFSLDQARACQLQGHQPTKWATPVKPLSLKPRTQRSRDLGAGSPELGASCIHGDKEFPRQHPCACFKTPTHVATYWKRSRKSKITPGKQIYFFSRINCSWAPWHSTYWQLGLMIKDLKYNLIIWQFWGHSQKHYKWQKD